MSWILAIIVAISLCAWALCWAAARADREMGEIIDAEHDRSVAWKPHRGERMKSYKTKGGTGSTSTASAGSIQRVSIEIISDLDGWEVDFKLTFEPEPTPNNPPKNGAVAAAVQILNAMAEHE